MKRGSIRSLSSNKEELLALWCRGYTTSCDASILHEQRFNSWLLHFGFQLPANVPAEGADGAWAPAVHMRDPDRVSDP